MRKEKRAQSRLNFAHYNTPEHSYKNHEHNITLYADENRNIWCYLCQSNEDILFCPVCLSPMKPYDFRQLQIEMME